MTKIKKLSAEDWGSYRAIRLESLKLESRAYCSSYEEEMNFSEEEWKQRISNTFAAFADDLPVGIITCIFNSKAKKKHAAEIVGFYVKKNYRGKGIGRELMGAAIAHIKKNKDIIKINLGVNPGQSAALRLYEKSGFTKAGMLKKAAFVDGTYHDELIMELFL